jgi:threonine/homoserine/homoserine lactone efflux protein
VLDPSILPLFLVAVVALVLTPGPNVLYIVARSVDQGRKAGFVSVLGIEAGTLFHIAAAALGLSALLAASALAFSLVKYAGAAYLIYLGIRTLLARTGPAAGERAAPKRLSRIFGQGMVVNLLNPKVALFFLAFLPQFVDPASASAALQMLVLGLIFFVVAFVNDVFYAFLAGTAGNWLRGSAVFGRVTRYTSGSVYIGLGVATAFSGSGKE